jgi:hypothetical protein
LVSVLFGIILWHFYEDFLPINHDVLSEQDSRGGDSKELHTRLNALLILFHSFSVHFLTDSDGGVRWQLGELE